MEPVEPVQLNNYQNNTYRKDLSWLNFLLYFLIMTLSESLWFYIISVSWAHLSWFFFFFSLTMLIHRTAREEKRPFLFLFTASRHSQTFRNLFTVLHLRCLSRVFNRSACYYHTSMRFFTLWEIASEWILMALKLDFTLDLTLVIPNKQAQKLNSHRLSPSYHKRTN